jgi:hypothetical protein
MGYNYLDLGPVPSGEDCVQVSSEHNYVRKMVRGCDIYRRQLEALFPIPDDLVNEVWFSVKREEHDFGPYYEVIVYYDDENEKAVEFAFDVEHNLPAQWSDIAKLELLQMPASQIL